MPTKPVSSVRLTFGQDGSTVDSFISVTERQTFSDPLGMLEFEVAPPPSKREEYFERLQKGELCGFSINDKPQSKMMIQERERVVSKDGGVVIRVRAISPLKVLYESSADPALSKLLESDAPLRDLVLEAVEPFGLFTLVAEDDVADIRAKSGTGAKATPTPVEALKYTEARVNDNETVYQFLARIITRFGVMLRLDVNNGLMLTRPHYDGGEWYTVAQGRVESLPNDADLFFGEVREIDSNEGQFQFCEVTGKRVVKPNDPKSGTPKTRVLSTDINATRPPFRASSAISYKPWFRFDQNCRDEQSAGQFSKLLLGQRAEKAYSISGTVQGLTSRTGYVWTIDTLATVFVEAIGVNETMWLAERQVQAHKNGGQHTRLTFIPKGYLVLGDV